MVRSFLAALLLISPASAAGEPAATGQAQAAPAERWARSETQISSSLAGIAFPLSAGAIRLNGARDFSNAETGIDSALQYSSADGKVIGTVYVYMPGLAHPGVTAFATEEVMRGNSPTPLRRVRSSLVPVGNVPNGAIRNDYENYRSLFSSAAFFKTGRWMIKLRVSGPSERRAEIEAAMDALLRGARIGVKNPVLAASVLEVGNCSAGEGTKDAKALPDPAGAELAPYGFLGTFDGGGHIATAEGGARNDLPSRIPNSALPYSGAGGRGAGVDPAVRRRSSGVSGRANAAARYRHRLRQVGRSGSRA
jgi:hypothetical protein